MAATSLSLLAGGAARSEAAPPETEPPAVVTFPANFDTWEPCETSESLTLIEWSSCSQAYNVDRTRSLLAIALVLIVGLLIAIWLALVTA